MTETIRIPLPQGEILAQLAEECMELAHAALKLRRAVEKRNPTPIGTGDAVDMLEEEYSDVLLCVEQLHEHFRPNEQTVNIIKATKLKRWMDRLQEARDHEQMAAGV